MFIAAGTLIDHKYEVINSIGVGGMGVVYEAYHRSLERVVAVKMLTATTTVDDEDRIRFDREALILSRLSHPNVVQFYAYGVWSDIPFIVIERVNGLSLQHLLASNQRLDRALVLDIARQVCEGLQHVHANDVLHRDLKPTNILMIEAPGKRRQVKLIDFGLAKLVDGDGVVQLTQAGMALGSVMYASPEQCLGRPVDARSDIYSLGCVVYQMLTGYPPYAADNATGVMFQQLNQSVGSTEHWSKVPVELQPVLSKCMAKEKELRYSSAAALNEDLGRVLGGLPAELEGVAVSVDFALPDLDNPIASAAPKETRADRKQFLVFTLALLVLCLIIVASLLPPGRSNAGTAERSTASVAHDQLEQIVNNGEAMNESQAKLLLSLIESYKADRDYSLDRSNLVLRAYQAAIALYERKKDFVAVRKYCQQALQDCGGVDVDNRFEYLSLVLSYHAACVPVHCQLSLITLLEDSLKRSPGGDLQQKLGLCLALASDYLELGRFDDAQQVAEVAASLAVHEQDIKRCAEILNECKSKRAKSSLR